MVGVWLLVLVGSLVAVLDTSRFSSTTMAFMMVWRIASFWVVTGLATVRESGMGLVVVMLVSGCGVGLGKTLAVWGKKSGMVRRAVRGMRRKGFIGVWFSIPRLGLGLVNYFVYLLVTKKRLPPRGTRR